MPSTMALCCHINNLKWLKLKIMIKAKSGRNDGEVRREKYRTGISRNLFMLSGWLLLFSQAFFWNIKAVAVFGNGASGYGEAGLLHFGSQFQI